MAYIPPHKRHLEDTEGPSPSLSSLIAEFKKKLNLRASDSNSDRTKDNALQGEMVSYARHSISRWWIVGLTDDDRLPASIWLEPISCESIEWKHGEKPLALVRGPSPRELNESFAKCPWVSITEKIQPDVLTSFASFQNMRNEMEFQEFADIKPSFVARFGKILFHGNPSSSLDPIGKSLAAETTFSQMKRSFYTNIPNSYMEFILGGVIPKIGVEFEDEKEYYHVKVFDKSRPDAIISCKCNAAEVGGELELRKIELNQVRHLVVDISCLDKNLDLSLMLSRRRILAAALTDDESHSLRNLIKSAVIDPNVKGGLRWPPGKDSFGGRFCAVGAWHTKVKAFKSSSMSLKLRHADRFDLRTSTGEVGREVILKMTGIARQLRDGMVEIGTVTKMLQDTLKLIWEHFLSCEPLMVVPEAKKASTRPSHSTEVEGLPPQGEGRSTCALVKRNPASPWSLFEEEELIAQAPILPIKHGKPDGAVLVKAPTIMEKDQLPKHLTLPQATLVEKELRVIEPLLMAPVKVVRVESLGPDTQSEEDLVGRGEERVERSIHTSMSHSSHARELPVHPRIIHHQRLASATSAVTTDSAHDYSDELRRNAINSTVKTFLMGMQGQDMQQWQGFTKKGIGAVRELVHGLGGNLSRFETRLQEVLDHLDGYLARDKMARTGITQREIEHRLSRLFMDIKLYSSSRDAITSGDKVRSERLLQNVNVQKRLREELRQAEESERTIRDEISRAAVQLGIINQKLESLEADKAKIKNSPIFNPEEVKACDKLRDDLKLDLSNLCDPGWVD